MGGIAVFASPLTVFGYAKMASIIAHRAAKRATSKRNTEESGTDQPEQFCST